MPRFFPSLISLDRCWRLPSWDRIEIPKPFARAVVVIGERIRIPANEGNDDQHQQRLQRVLEELRAQSDQAVKSV